MFAPTQPRGLVRFGDFAVDLRSGELHKEGVKIKLQEQPFRLMIVLLEHSGEVVTRDELRKRLWPEDTFGAFDDGLNTAIKKLRDALGDSAEEPRLIETLPKHGYRFILPVTTIAAGPSSEYSTQTPDAASQDLRCRFVVGGLSGAPACEAAGNTGQRQDHVGRAPFRKSRRRSGAGVFQ